MVGLYLSIQGSQAANSNDTVVEQLNLTNLIIIDSLFLLLFQHNTHEVPLLRDSLSECTDLTSGCNVRFNISTSTPKANNNASQVAEYD